MGTCSKCRSEIAPGDVFCGGCGSRQPAPHAQVSPGQNSRLVAAAGFESPPPVAVGAGFEPAAGGAGAHSAPGHAAGGARAAGPAGEPPDTEGNIQQPPVTSTGAAASAPRAAAPPARAAAPAPRAATPGSRTATHPSRAALIRAGETLEQKYMRQTRSATVFIAVVVGIFTALALIGVIWTATNVARLDSQLTGIPSVNTNNCLSQGGTNPDC